MKNRKIVSIFALTSFCLSLSSLQGLPTLQKESKPLYSDQSGLLSQKPVEEGYTINFDNVPILELIKFISKIANINFIYEEKDLNFNVSLVSQEPTELDSVIAALIQVLRLNGLDLIEQGKNLVISRESVKQIATVVSSEVPLERVGPLPLMTRVFRVKNANPNSLANLIRPLLSPNAILEVSQETRHLIITDIAQNIEEIYKLFSSLDSPQSSLEIDSYKTTHTPPETLIPLATQLLTPISQGNPLIFVPQSNTNTIFIVSTPFLIEKAIGIFEDLDSPPSIKEIQGALSSKNILLYLIKNKPADSLQSALQDIVSTLTQIGPAAEDLTETLKRGKFIKQSHTLLFTGHGDSLKEVQQILESLDVPYNAEQMEHLTGGFYLYKIKQGKEEQIKKSLETVVEHLKKGAHPDDSLIEAIGSMQSIPETHSLIFTGDQPALNKLKALLPSFDISEQEGGLPISDDFLIYTPKNEPPSALLTQIETTHANLKNSDFSDLAFLNALSSAKLSSSELALTFTGTSGALSKVQALVSLLDQAKGAQLTYMYQIQFASPDTIQKGLQKIAASLSSDKDLGEVVREMQYIRESHAYVFRGPKETIEQIQTILPTIDRKELVHQSKLIYSVYPLKKASGNAILKQLEETAKSIQNSGAEDPDLIQSIQNVRWIESSNSLIITGPASVVNRIQAMIETFDSSKSELTTSSFYVYQPVGESPEAFKTKVLSAAKEMEAAGLEDWELITTLKSASMTSNQTAILFTGTAKGIEKVKQIAATFDPLKGAEASEFYLYKPQSIPAEKLIETLKRSAAQLKNSGLKDPDLIYAMESAHLTEDAHRIILTGTPLAIEKVKVMVHSYDTQEKELQSSHYYIFKPQHQSPEEIIKQASHASLEMRESGLKDPNLIAALSSATIVSNGTGVLFTGTQEAIIQAKEIIPTFDHVDETAPQPSEFYVYKPTYISAEELRKHAQTVAEHIESSRFADRALIHTLKETRLVSNGKSVLFTGTQTSIAKVQDLLPFLDSASEDGLKQAEKTTFTIYKIQHLSGPALLNYLKNMAADLERAGSTQSDLIATLTHIRYVQDTNSIILTGPPSAVQEAIKLAEKFDIPDLAKQTPARAPSGYLIYDPKYLPGEELIKILRDFEQNLVTSGISDQHLFDVINNLKWMEKTSSILISGNDEETKKVYAFLEKFDVPLPGGADQETRIETISEMSFLIYKLQYHSGAEIQDAIKLIGVDLEKSKTKTGEALLQAINTVQWIQVTNSLIATGQPESLTKLKELIKSVDIPLKQVFVEVLVIETTMSNNLQFGLRWGSQGKLFDKFAYGTGVFPQSGSSDPLVSFQQNLSKIDGTNTPKGSYIPFAGGGDLGVIGDIILHKGKSYFALGSLINAIKDEGDSLIVMNQKIVAQDNKTSTIFVGQNIPYTGSFVKNESSNITTSANLEYRDVGVSLKITPVVGNSDVITLMIEEDISEKLNGSDSSASASQVQGITTNKSSTKTVISVPDKSFLVLSGSMQDSKIYHRTGVPCLGGLPLIGAAFSDQQKHENLSNLVIFVRPQIIKSFETYQEITERQEDLYRSQTVAEDFDAGLELVKTPDDTHY